MTLVRGYANSMVKDFPFWVRNSEPAPEVVPNAPPIKVRPACVQPAAVISAQVAALGAVRSRTGLDSMARDFLSQVRHSKPAPEVVPNAAWISSLPERRQTWASSRCCTTLTARVAGD